MTTTRTLDETVTIPHGSRRVDDPDRDLGTSAVVTAGVDGIKMIQYLVILKGGLESGRTVTGERVTRQSVSEVTAVGTKPPAAPKSPVSAAPAPGPADASGDCDPNYAGGCVPVDSDVDCLGGKGNGPSYVQGPVRVVGRDIYGLDADHDGIGCE